MKAAARLQIGRNTWRYGTEEIVIFFSVPNSRDKTINEDMWSLYRLKSYYLLQCCGYKVQRGTVNLVKINNKNRFIGSNLITTGILLNLSSGQYHAPMFTPYKKFSIQQGPFTQTIFFDEDLNYLFECFFLSIDYYKHKLALSRISNYSNYYWLNIVERIDISFTFE